MSSPLAGLRVVITRAEGQGESLAAQLAALGATPLLHPMIAFAPPLDPAPLDAVLADVRRYAWVVLTSPNAASALAHRLAALGVGAGALSDVRLAAVGPATAQVLAARGMRVALVPRRHIAEGLLEEIGEVAGERVLLPCADIARETLADGLRARGALVDAVVAYRTVPGQGAATLAPLLLAGQVDAITFTSSSTVRYMIEGLAQAGLTPADLPALLNPLALIFIGPATARTASDLGLAGITAQEYTSPGITAALLGWAAQRR
ncbi:uroporphyrinogen-III synthase [Chloroflexia bacterium SDU3-3]|nr:uroporphyrinogen-III synthase [Chloroflexia bacterium SDU3-3]